MRILTRLGIATSVVALALALTPAIARAQVGIGVTPYYSNYGSPYAYVGPNGVGMGYGYPVGGGYYGNAYGNAYPYYPGGYYGNNAYYGHPYHNNYPVNRANSQHWHRGWW